MGYGFATRLNGMHYRSVVGHVIGGYFSVVWAMERPLVFDGCYICVAMVHATISMDFSTTRLLIDLSLGGCGNWMGC